LWVWTAWLDFMVGDHAPGVEYIFAIAALYNKTINTNL